MLSLLQNSFLFLSLAVRTIKRAMGWLSVSCMLRGLGSLSLPRILPPVSHPYAFKKQIFLNLFFFYIGSLKRLQERIMEIALVF